MSKPMTALQPGERVAVARKLACDRNPYFSTGLMALVVIDRPGMGTFGVSKYGHLFIDHDKLAQMSPEEAATEYLHEYMHIFYKHAARFEALVSRGVLTTSQQDRSLWNIAADAEINDNIAEAGHPFSRVLGHPVLPSSLGLEDHRLAEWYVEQLLKRRARGKNPLTNMGSCPEGSLCLSEGSGAGTPLEDEPEERPGGRTEVDDQLDHEAVCRAIQRSKNHGSMAADWVRQAEQDLAPPKVAWWQKLASAARSAVTFVQGSIDYTYAQRSRWQVVFAGQTSEPVLPSMHAPLSEVAFAFDTSGSMSADDLATILNESVGVLKALGGARITLLSCDAELHTVKKVSTAEQIRAGLKGGGGTNFRPVFKAVDRMRPRPDLLVFGTDGYGDYPDREPPYRVIWLCVAEGTIQVDWGEVIDVGTDEL